MFIQLDPVTIQGGEYDNGTTKLEDIKFEKLDVNELGNYVSILLCARVDGFAATRAPTTP